jgi:hypothetical protein
MKSRARLVTASLKRHRHEPACALLGALLLVACSKAREVASRGTSETQSISAAAPGECAHAVCADNFFVDAAPATCSAGAPCAVALKLVATGDFHVNDEYPYRFKADDAPGVTFLGTDPGGRGTFSKFAGDWQKADAKSGAMTVKFIAADPGPKAIAGTLKLSVCSAAACLLEQRQVTANVVTK